MEKLKKLQLDEVMLTTEETKLILGGGDGDGGPDYPDIDASKCNGGSGCQTCGQTCKQSCSPGCKRDHLSGD